MNRFPWRKNALEITNKNVVYGAILIFPFVQVKNAMHFIVLPFVIQILIHSANPHSRPVVIILSTHVVRPSVPTFQNKTSFTRKQCRLLGLAEWIIDENLLYFLPEHLVKKNSDRHRYKRTDVSPTEQHQKLNIREDKNIIMRYDFKIFVLS